MAVSKNNNHVYHLYKTPPKWARKTIIAGRLKGKTDISPQWRIETLNNTFGLCGFGWKYDVVRTWTERIEGNDEVSAYAEILLFVKVNEDWSAGIPGIGGSMLIAKEKNGPYTSDECYKMAITDALSVACKQLGIGSAVYSGDKYPVQSIESLELIKSAVNECQTEKELEVLFSSFEKENHTEELIELFRQRKKALSE